MKLFGVTRVWKFQKVEGIEQNRSGGIRFVDCWITDTPEQLLSQEWEIKPHKGRQRKFRSRTIDDIIHSLSLDKGELLDDIHEGICMATVMRELHSCFSLDQDLMV